MTESSEHGYRTAGFGGEIGFGRRAALIVVDMVMAYFAPSSPMYAGVESTVASNARLVEAAYRKQVPVVFTRPLFDKAQTADIYVRKVPALKLLGPRSPLSVLEPWFSNRPCLQTGRPSC